MEIIGEVVIDTSLWTGSDRYSDGEAEADLLQRISSGESESAILSSDTRFPILYHLSPERQNILSWFPLQKSWNVLEIGAGCGAVTGLLTARCAHVTAVDLSLVRCRINAWRHRSAYNLSLIAADCMDLPERQEYDLITLIGVLEYACVYSDKDDPFESMLRHCRNMLKPGGRLVIAIENQFGLKYFCGAREDHHWKVNEGLYGYPNGSAKTFSKDQLCRILKKSGFSDPQFYGVYPDYKFPRILTHEKAVNSSPVEYPPMDDFGEFECETADPCRVLRELAKSGLQVELANSFFVCVGPNSGSLPSYVKIASNRDARFASFTSLYPDHVIKAPLFYGSDYIESNLHGKKLIEDKIAFLGFPEMTVMDDMLWVERINGKSLQDMISESDVNTGRQLFQKYCHFFDSLTIAPEAVSFSDNPRFQQIFGSHDAPDMTCVSPAPIDMNLSNILATDKHFFAVDTEWVFDFPVPLKYILWRAIFLYGENTGSNTDQFISDTGITEEEIKVFQKFEFSFSNYVFGETSPANIKKQYTKKTLVLSDLIFPDEARKLYVTIDHLKKESDTAWAQFAEREKQLDAVRKESSEKTALISDLSCQVSSVKRERDTAWEQFSEREIQLDAIRKELLDKSAMITELINQVETLRKECDMAWSQFSDRERQLEQARREVYSMRDALDSMTERYVNAADQLSSCRHELDDLNQLLPVKIYNRLTGKE